MGSGLTVERMWGGECVHVSVEEREREVVCRGRGE